jgi:hypothetical protein
MHGVAVRVSIADRDAALKTLHEQVVPRAKSASGFVSGTWLYMDEGAGNSLLVFESEENAREFADGFSPPADAPVSLETIGVGEVVAQA